jgi:hypothetical protein
VTKYGIKWTTYTVYRQFSASNTNSGHDLAAFAKQRKATTGFICLPIRPTVRPSVGQHLTTRLKLGGFSWNTSKKRRMRSLCWITKATNRQSEHVIIITFPRQQWLRERALIRRYMHVVCLVTNNERNGN